MIKYQTAQKEDVKDIIFVHNSSVVHYGSAFYSEEILKLWSPPATEKRIRALEAAVSNPDEFVILAKDGNRTAGVGILIIPAGKIGMVYIHPDYGGKGIGTEILRKMEVRALEERVTQLTLDSSLNAEKFYRKNNYLIIKHDFHDLGLGFKMECVRMEKNLGDA